MKKITLVTLLLLQSCQITPKSQEETNSFYVPCYEVEEQREFYNQKYTSKPLIPKKTDCIMVNNLEIKEQYVFKS